jgi:hypothetical protein
MRVSKRVLFVTVGLGFILGAALEMDLGVVRLAMAVDQPPAQSETPPWKDSVPENSSDGVFLTPIEYAKLIEPELGVPPVVDCGTSVEIPIYVNGVEFVGNPGIHGCDNPSLQVGDCMSGSSVGRYDGVAANGDPLSQVVWISYCRHEGRPGTETMGNVDSVQMIGHNDETGATAFYESGKNAEWTYTDPKTNRLMGKMPGTNTPDAFNRAYTTAGNIQCVSCHQNDPFVHNPYIDGAKLPGTTDLVIPRVRTRDADVEFDNPYYIIGANNWDLRTIHIDGNECLECHRMGMKTVELFMANRWHPNDHMPPKDPGSLAGDFQALLDCWKNGPDHTPACDWIIPPAGNTMGRIVGNEYPHKAKFNAPSAFFYADLQAKRDGGDDDKDKDLDKDKK